MPCTVWQLVEQFRIGLEAQESLHCHMSWSEGRFQEELGQESIIRGPQPGIQPWTRVPRQAHLQDL